LLESEGRIALKYLADIKWFTIDDPSGFKIELSFDTNPFFKTFVLTKTYLMIDEDDTILEKAIGYVIIYLFKTPLYKLKVDPWMPDPCHK
jgi:hypothetical protein